MISLIVHNCRVLTSVRKPLIKCVLFLYDDVFLNTQLKQADGQSEAAKQRELQKKIEQLRAEISHLDSQISGTEEQLASQGESIT